MGTGGSEIAYIPLLRGDILLIYPERNVNNIENGKALFNSIIVMLGYRLYLNKQKK